MKTTNSFRSKLFALTLALVASVSSFAYNFGSGGLFFNIIDYDNYLAEVTYQKERSEENYDNLTHVTIPDTVMRGRVKYAVVSIGNMAFHKCQTLESIVIPDHITNIGTNVFDGCTALTSVQLPRTITYLNSSLFSNCKSLRTFTIPDNITSIYGSVFQSCHSLSEVNIPSSVTSIGKYAFRYCNSLKSITIPNSVKTIDRGAFYQCKALTDVQLPDSLTTITQEMFFECTALESITIPAGVTHIEKDAFDWCSKLKTMTLHNKIEYIDEWAFSQTEISTFVLAMKNAEEACNNRVNKILHNIGQQYATRKITIAGEKVRDLVVPNIVDSISDYAFAYSYIASVDIPNNLKRINPTAFYKCPSLQSVCWNALDFEEVDTNTNAPFHKVASQIHTFKFGRDIKHIPAYLCYDMNRLDSIEIPAGVKSIGKHAFAHCSPSVVICHATQVPDIDESAFSKDYVSNTILYVPAESVEQYKNSEQWNKFAHIVAIGDKIEETDSNWDWNLVHDFAVDNFGYAILENATTPSVQIIEAVGKSGHVDIPTEVMHNDTLYKVTGLGTGIVTTFRYSPNLTSVFIPKEILLVNNAVFADCPNLESIVVEEGNVYQDSRDNCNAVIRNLYSDRSPELVIGCKNTTIPNGVLSIGSYAFRGCKGLQEIEIPSSVTTIYRSAFYDCISLKSVVLGENITSIEDLAFYNCYNLEKIVSLSLTPPSKGASAFNSTPITDPDIEERAPIYVPDASVEVYKQAWKDYNIQPLSSMPVSEDLFPTLAGLQRTSCTKTIGEDEYGTVWGSRSYLMQEIQTTTIDGKQYIVFGDEYDRFALREENNKILVYSSILKKDLVLYDFTLEVGDSLPALYYELRAHNAMQQWLYNGDIVDYNKNDDGTILPAETFVVTDISTITLLDGKEYKKWTFDNGMEYVEGIGSFGTSYAWNDFYQLIANGPLYSDVFSQHLVCISKNGQLLYKMDDAEMERLGAECLCDVETSYKSQWCNTWNVMWFDGMRFDETARTSKYRLGKDTVIGDYTYSKFISGTYVRFTDDRKVYVYHEYFDDHDPYSEDLPTGEYLAYDFSAQVGDTLEVFSGVGTYSTYPCVVDDVQIDSETNLRTMTLHKICRIDEEDYDDSEMTWIEGVGSPEGFLISYLPCGWVGGGTYALLCAYQGDELKYTGSLYERFGCDYKAGVVSDDLFPTLSGLQRTICREYCEQADNKTRIEQFTNLTTRTETGGPYLYYSPFLLREKDNKILIYSRTLNKDLVLYDFNLQVGDSLPMLYIDFFAKDDWIADRDMEIWCVVDYHKDLEGNILPADTLIVTDVSMITLLDGKEYKKWTFNNGMEYAEGIGSLSGDFYELIANKRTTEDLTASQLVCASQNGQLLYKMDDAEMERLGVECLCEYNDGPKKDNAKDGKIGGRPTPTQWNMLEMVVREMENNKTILQAETFSYTLEDNSRILNNKTYFDLARQSTRDTAITKSVVGALHFSEDEGNRVYFLCDGMEYLLYDFTAEPGDSIEIFAGINNYPQATTYTHVVTGKDTLENGACRMVLEVVFPNQTGGTNLQKVWLAGLGSLDGIVHNSAQQLSNARSAETESSVMLCAWREDDCLYTTDHPEFDKVGCVYNLPTAVDDIQTPENQYQKIIHNGHLYILRNNKIYDVLGTPLTNH